ncbi:MAG: hypothetical protein GY793_03235 [Proteobacteria bacterium]|nr:hypothetical protein [Pseudomonadota bacterium]
MRHIDYKQKQRGAMFGLDARVALAIFTTLSVIAGTTLYMAIRNVKATTALVQLQELGKAWEVYYLDTGVNLDIVSDGPNFKAQYLDIRDLTTYTTGNTPGWDGPYFNCNRFLPDTINRCWSGQTDPNFRYYLVIRNGSPTSFIINFNLCGAGTECFVWANIWTSSLSLSDVKSIDDKVDGGDGDTVGNFRWYTSSGGELQVIYLKIASIKNPYD